ncbi:hypothetical protein GCM10017786_37670 [Amycolatopsis deserti]|uniref:HTH lysR-type domain-containing protein n=1 Tax=Amycolatopsis deserti TaxID=185696 RepID=A0ABQ3J389_9PSEU|nr:hypothetical protein GCM10017786_37670 [Amycolatopsis deserti]
MKGNNDLACGAPRIGVAATVSTVDDLDLGQLRSFLAVTRERSITRAGVALNLTQQAVSKHVRQLERSLGVTLLVRTSRGVLLTAAGEQLAADAPALLHDVGRVAERARAAGGAESGTLRLVCCPATTALFAVAVVESLEATVPGLQVTMTTA